MNIKQLITFYCITDQQVISMFKQIKETYTPQIEDYELLFLIFQSYNYINQQYNKHIIKKCSTIQMSLKDYMIQTRQIEKESDLLLSPNQKKYITQYLITLCQENEQQNQINITEVDENQINVIYDYIKVVNDVVKINLSEWILKYLSQLIQDSLNNIKIDAIYFLKLNRHNGSDFMTEVMMCRKLAFLGFECNKINIFYINSTLFEDQVQQIERQKKQEDRNRTFSTLIPCRFCKKFMITFTSKQTSLGSDEISKNLAKCNNYECRRTFITV